MSGRYGVAVPASDPPVDPPEPAGTRRDRVRRRTLDEIKAHALAQIAEGGVAALSLNAVGRAMGMSGPAVYRYFASRDALLAALVVDGYASLTATLRRAATDARRRAPAGRLRAVADAYRAWAVERPQLYALLFGLRPAGGEDTEEAIDAIDGAMDVLLETLGAIAGDEGRGGVGGPLDAELLRWAAGRRIATAGDPPDPALLRLGVVVWTRLHGLVGLELSGILGSMGLDPGRLLETELRTIVGEATDPLPGAAP